MIKINKEIIDYVLNSDFDEKIKNFLIQSLILEFKRDKADYSHYAKEYDDILNRFVR